MILIRDTLAGEPIKFYYPQSTKDLYKARDFILDNRTLAFDTESTGLNCYKRGWQLRMAQWGNASTCYVIPAQYRKFIGWAMRQGNKLIGHNGPHDIRCVDQYLGYETGVVCAGETYLPAHHADSRDQSEGGTGHGLKELAIALVDRQAGKWETELKKEFKKITIRVPGEFYKSGPRKGAPKFRKAKLAEGWSLIDPEHPAYIAYAGSDPILTWRVGLAEQSIFRNFRKLYLFDHDVQLACDQLQRRGILLDVSYTERLGRALERKAGEFQEIAREYGCDNIQSTAQIAEVLLGLRVRLREKTDSGKWKVDQHILRGQLKSRNTSVREFVQSVLVAKQLLKRKKAYTDTMLEERDIHDRIHTSLNSLAARTTRMSASKPALQQLPTKDHEDELTWDDEQD